MESRVTGSEYIEVDLKRLKISPENVERLLAEEIKDIWVLKKIIFEKREKGVKIQNESRCERTMKSNLKYSTDVITRYGRKNVIVFKMEKV